MRKFFALVVLFLTMTMSMHAQGIKFGVKGGFGWSVSSGGFNCGFGCGSSDLLVSSGHYYILLFYFFGFYS